MPTAEAIKSIWGQATPANAANAANAAKPRMNTWFARLRTVCESCEPSAAKRGQDIAANSAKPRMTACDSQDSQPCLRGKSASEYVQRTSGQIRNFRKPFATAGTRMKPSDSQDSQDSQGGGGGNAFSAIAAALVRPAAVTLTPYPAHSVRRHALGD